jgi:hypothetical protein
LQNECSYHSEQSEKSFLVLILWVLLKISPAGRNDKNVDPIIFDRGSIKGIETSPNKKLGGGIWLA